MFFSADQALDRFAMKRFYDDKLGGLAIPSHKRLVYCICPLVVCCPYIVAWWTWLIGVFFGFQSQGLLIQTPHRIWKLSEVKIPTSVFPITWNRCQVCFIFPDYFTFCKWHQASDLSVYDPIIQYKSRLIHGIKTTQIIQKHTCQNILEVLNWEKNIARFWNNIHYKINR